MNSPEFRRLSANWVIIFVHLTSPDKQHILPEAGSLVNPQVGNDQGERTISATRTAFAVCIYMPRSPRQPQRHAELNDLTMLPRALVSIKNSVRPLCREPKAVNTMTASTQTKHLKFVRTITEREHAKGYFPTEIDLPEGLCDHLEGPAKSEAVAKNKAMFNSTA